MKKLFLVALSIVMTMGILPVGVVAAESVLTMTLKAGKTYAFKKTSTDDNKYMAKASSAAQYNIVYKDDEGNTTRFLKAQSRNNDFHTYDILTLSSSQKHIEITVGGNDLEIYYPSDWNGRFIAVSEVSVPVLAVQTLDAGKTYAFKKTSTDDNKYMVKASGAAQYDIVYKDDEGNTTRFLKAQSRNNDFRTYDILTLSSSQKHIEITVGGNDLEIYYPSDWNNSVISLINTSVSTTTDSIYDVTDPGTSMFLPVDKLSTVVDKNTATKVIQDATTGATTEQKTSSTGADLLTLFAEEAVSQAAATTVSGSSITINQEGVQSLQATANDVKAAAEQALAAAGVMVRRELNADVKFKTTSSASVSITIDPSAADTTADNVRVETPGFALSFSKDSIKDNTADGPLVITVTESTQSAQVASADPAMASMMLVAANTKTYAISFNKPVTANVKVSLPPAAGNPTYQAVTNSAGAAVGGKYNPVTGKLEVKIKAGDTYTVRENKKNFSDITAKSNEMQEAINILASKGIISGTSATTFAPDSPITRAEIAALITRTLSKLDPNANGGFTDVAKADWYYGAAGSAKAYGIMNGTSATTFAPKVTIAKDQITAVAARVLRTEMNYKDPANTSSLLSTYTDSSKLASWSLTDLALATRENLVVKRSDGMFNPSGTMTRGDAAIVLYRMFLKIW